MRLCDVPVGLFLFEDTLCLMTEYSSSGCGREAYIVSSGEMFWGGAKSKEERADLEVTPVTVMPAKLRLKGRWDPDLWRPKCSLCGFRGSLFDIPVNPFNYCPNCGAKMENREANE